MTARRPMAYIAGPISKGDLAHNINQATVAFIELTLAGFAPLCPHWSAFSGGALVSATGASVYAIASAAGCGLSHADWLAVDLAFVERSDVVLRLPGESTGADMETAHATACGIPVFHSVAEVVAWFRAQEVNQPCPEVEKPTPSHPGGWPTKDTNRPNRSGWAKKQRRSGGPLCR